MNQFLISTFGGHCISGLDHAGIRLSGRVITVLFSTPGKQGGRDEEEEEEEEEEEGEYARAGEGGGKRERERERERWKMKEGRGMYGEEAEETARGEKRIQEGYRREGRKRKNTEEEKRRGKERVGWGTKKKKKKSKLRGKNER